MNRRDENKWPAILFFLASGLFFFGCVWYLWAGTMNPEKYWPDAEPERASFQDRIARPDGSIVLVRNHGVRVDGARIVYRGSHAGCLQLDLYILALDPHYGYPHRIEEKSARQGFVIGSHHFQLIAAGGDSIRIRRM